MARQTRTRYKLLRAGMLSLSLIGFAPLVAVMKSQDSAGSSATSPQTFAAVNAANDQQIAGTSSSQSSSTTGPTTTSSSTTQARARTLTRTRAS
jgi:hypothetical protein